MYTVSAKILLEMREVRAHEQLKLDGVLTEYEQSLGRAMFVSHQWLSDHHPDPCAEQFKVLQDALTNMLSGRSEVQVPPVMEIQYGRMKTPTSAGMTSKPLFVWYDYFSCPQGSDFASAHSRQCAIDTIVSYVARCEYFVILCPAVTHADQTVLGEDVWATRGWCRLERLARELAERDDGFVIVVHSAFHQSLIFNTSRHLDAPGAGHFTWETDRCRIVGVIVQMIWKKLHYFLEQGDFHNYRFLLNTQSPCCLRDLDALPVEGLVPGFVPRSDPFKDEETFVVEWFLHENGFQSVQERDSAGWTPICYAVMAGNPGLVQALLKQRADCNDRILRHKPDIGFCKKTPVLALAAHFGNNETLRVLLRSRADVHARASHRGIALHSASFADNVEGVRLLCSAKSDPGKRMLPGLDAFELACSAGSWRVIGELQPERSIPKHSLHFALMISGGSAACISILIQARADVNEQLRLEQPMWRIVFTALSIRHRLSPSALTTLAYQHLGATPLMFSVLTGNFKATAQLLEAQADVEMRNARGKTAVHFARQAQAPASLIDALEGWAVPAEPRCPLPGRAWQKGQAVSDDPFISVAL